MPKINRDQLATITIALPTKNDQIEMVKNINFQVQILEGLQKMKSEAETKISKLLADVWGVEFAEPVNMEGEDEQED